MEFCTQPGAESTRFAARDSRRDQIPISATTSLALARVGRSQGSSQFAKFHLTNSHFANVMRGRLRLHIITRRKLLEAAEKCGDLGESLDVWYRVAKRAKWKNLMDVRQVFPTADAV